MASLSHRREASVLLRYIMINLNGISVNYQIITTLSELDNVCRKARNSDMVMLDTEFVRTRTYYPQLGLIQLYDGSTLSLIDPLALTDMTPFVELLQDVSVLKVLHACGEDLEVFQNTFSCTPIPIVDTQVMASFLGNGVSTGFAALVKSFLDVDLDKSESRTDWTARPLTEKQLEYAAADVFYLYPLFETLYSKVIQLGWWEAAQQESDLIMRKRVRETKSELAYLDIKGAWQLRPAELAILKLLATWRYEEAIKRDLALNFVFREGELLTVAKMAITDTKTMEKQGVDPRAIRRHGTKIISLVKQGKATPKEEYPDRIERLMDAPGYKQLFKQLKDEVKRVSINSGLTTEFLASKKQLNQLIKWIWKQDRDPARLPDLMQGWRLELLGEKLTKLVP
ncbi:Ribonuclease D [Vibrio marisflavi CECT 7928]|uniref:Ribonuclease D n=2 Tax=Vibrio marisflavi TaxID=1216040 RepID=A0ABN8E2I0_9VIBR|nr:Ribonuclease D [Vibrio marisflavi CECT 7928]